MLKGRLETGNKLAMPKYGMGRKQRGWDGIQRVRSVQTNCYKRVPKSFCAVGYHPYPAVHRKPITEGAERYDHDKQCARTAAASAALLGAVRATSG